MACAVALTAAAWVPAGERTRQACPRPSPRGPPSFGAEAAGVTLAEEEGKASDASKGSFTESGRLGGP